MLNSRARKLILRLKITNNNKGIIDNVHINNVYQSKILDENISLNLNWNNHINAFVNKAVKECGLPKNILTNAEYKLNVFGITFKSFIQCYYDKRVIT